MNSKAAVGWMLVSVALAGCSQTFGKGGSLDRALDKDQKNLLEPGHRGRLHDYFCAGGREHTELCRWARENPEEADALMREEED